MTKQARMIPIHARPLYRLCEYWMRAEMMRELAFQMQDHVLVKRRSMVTRQKYYWQLLTLMSHWLSALFVCVEGFNKLKLKDARVQKLFKANVALLKQVRHDTYHFSADRKGFFDIAPELEWADALHLAIGEVVSERLHRIGVEPHEHILYFGKPRARRDIGLTKAG